MRGPLESSEGRMLLRLRECGDNALAGGKAVNLAGLLNAGFNVPDGFVVTTEAYRRVVRTTERTRSAGRARASGMPNDLADGIRRFYRDIGSPPVAVRSSATAEDMAEASMAGQYETFYVAGEGDVTDPVGSTTLPGRRGEDSLLDAIQKCWASLDSPRTRSYLKEHGIDIGKIAMAVVVQRLVPADVAGVLFTANPRTGSRDEMVIEANWGLGESVVSGGVQPDVLRVERATGRVLEARIADKRTCVDARGRRERAVEESKRGVACLGSSDVAKLVDVGCAIAEHFGLSGQRREQDIEWAIHDGELFVLQSRAITTLEDADAYAKLLRDTRARLRELAGRSRGGWARHNIGETLPHPTPLTWSVVKRFMSGSGGFGRMYREVGFEPSEDVSRDGFLELIAGEVYMDLSLAPEMFFEGFPFAYDLDRLRRDPNACQEPPTIPSGAMSRRVAVGRRVARVNARMRQVARDFDGRLREEIIPAFVSWCREERKRDLSALPPADLMGLWKQRERAVLDEFAPQSLLPSLIAGMALQDLRAFLEEHFWDEDPDDLVNLLSSSHAPDKTMAASAELYEVASGTRTAEEWLAGHGHRAAFDPGGEFDLATPRWRERPEDLAAMARRLEGGADPTEVHRKHIERAERRLAELKSRLSERDGAELDRRLGLVRRYLIFREDGKYYLMLGYDLLRDTALEAGRRLGVDGDVFMLTFEEMADAVATGFAPLRLIDDRRRRRRAEEKLALPHVIDERSIDAIGEPIRIEGGERAAAFPVSTGSAAGPARIVLSPESAADMGTGYVLVCPSTDPAWTPLFVNAVGLVLECGGTLSHGAVVAREMGIPAVVLPGATKMFRDGEVVAVDGREGCVARVREGREEDEGGKTPCPAEVDAESTRIPRGMVPPVPGRRERAAGRLRNWFLVVWGVYLVAAFLLPEPWLYGPSIALLDKVLWPVSLSVGKPGAVAVVALFFAALTMVGQRLLTDNRRLSEAKRRSARLRKEAAGLPEGSPRLAEMTRLAGSVQTRLLGASFVPLAVVLGPMLMSFMWFPDRVDPAAWNAPPGSAVNVEALVDSDLREPVTLEVAEPLYLAEFSPREQRVPPRREALEGLLAEWSQPSDVSDQPWEMREAASWIREAKLADLKAYLDEGVPPEKLGWKVLSKEGAAGKFPVMLRAGGAEPLTIHVILGESFPPAPAKIVEDPASPLLSLEVIYNKPPRVFWSSQAVKWLPGWANHWLLVYLITYMPGMFILRWVLRIA